MAEEEKGKDKEGSAPKGSKLPWILLAAVVVAGGGGGAAFFFLKGDSGGEKSAQAAKPPEPVKPMIQGQIGPLHTMDSMIVNLDEPGGNRYLKILLTLELTQELDDNSKNLIPRARDQILVYLSSLTVEQVQKTEVKLEMKKKVAELVNETFGVPLVKQVYFKELVMQ